MPRKKSAITEKQQAYVDGVMEGRTKMQAAADAGYSNGNSALIERSETVREALAAARSELSDVTTLRRVDVIEGLMESIDMARTMAEPNAMISGWREIAKIMGHYAPEVRRLELSSEDANVLRKMEQLSDAELYEIMRKRHLEIDVTPQDGDE